MAKWDNVSKTIGQLADTHLLKVLDRATFKEEHPEGERLGSPGATAVTYEDEKDSTLVVKVPTSTGHISDLVTEAEVIRRLEGVERDVSKAGISVPRAQGEAVGLEKFLREPEKACGFFKYFEKEIVCAHAVGAAVIDIKADMIMAENNVVRQPVDFSSAVLLPEWGTLRRAIALRNGWEEFLEKTAPPKSVLGKSKIEELKKGSEITLEAGDLKRLKEKLVRVKEAREEGDMDGLQRGMINISSSDRLMRTFLGPKDYVRLQNLLNPELEEKHLYSFWLNSGKDKRNDERIINGNREAAEMLIKKGEEMGIIKNGEEIKAEPKVITLESVPEKKPKISTEIVSGLFSMMGYDGHLNYDELVNRIRNEPLSQQVSLVKDTFGRLNILAQRIEKGSDVRMATVEFVGEFDNFLSILFSNFFMEVVGDWKKVGGLMENPSLCEVKGNDWDELKANLKNKIGEMDRALKEKNYDRITDLERELILN